MAELDNYLPCDAYSGAPDSEKYPGFKSWHDTETNLWYFAAITNKGRVVLRSEGYTTEAARDNGIESVMRNRDIEERYSITQEEGNWYTILKAGNHQEIARSCAYDSEADAKAGIAAAASTFVERATNAPVEDYQDCAYYANRPASEKYPGFHTWQDEENGQFYFALVSKKGDVLLRSEGYTKESSRDNGIESVMRNRDIEERYASVREGEEWFLCLRAGNHQEIARSCPVASEAAAHALRAHCFSTFGERSANAVGDDYLACDAYASHPHSEKHPGFTVFSDAATGLHYFAMVDGHEGVILRSEGYTSASSRDNGIESVLRNRDIDDRYVIAQNEADGQWYVSLRAGNRQEIARSCGFADQAAAEAHLLHCYSKAYLERIATGADQIIEDYLPCAAYEGKPASPDYPGFTIFQDEKTGLHYFAMLKDDGTVALKSEGYKDPKRRDNGIESVIRNRGIAEHWREMEDEHGAYMSLRAVNHQEIARSCHYKDSAAMLAWFTPFLAGHGAWKGDAEPEDTAALAALAAAAVAPAAAGKAAAAAAGAAAVGAAAAAAASGPKVVTTGGGAVPPPITSYTNAPEAAAGGSDWWKWLLGALLLLGLLWLLFRGCEGCGAKKNTTTVETAPPPTTATPAPTTPAPTTAAPTTPPPPACNCSGNADALFNIPSGEPKSLTRLGTNPEFGNSHGLTPAEFYDKLAKAAKANAVDARFLDRVFKGMGYKGFSDAKPEMFSTVTLTPGTTGNMGYSKAHKTVFARLDTQGKDLEAFRIKAANGCDFHFMKTCGNHFFTCPK
jgi:uncharacterized protein YegP (UPF0339 family)